MKTLTAILLLYTYLLQAQFTNNVSLNTKVSSPAQEVTGQRTASTLSGKSYVVYFDGYAKVKVQLLDNNGNNLFSSGGIPLMEIVSTWSADALSIIVINNEEALIAISNWANNNEVNIFHVNNIGVVKPFLHLGYGTSPQLCSLGGNEFMATWNTDNSSAMDQCYLQKFDINIGKLWPAPKVLDYGCEKMIAVSSSKFYMIACDNLLVPPYANAVAKLFDDNGNMLWPNAITIIDNYTYWNLYTSPTSTFLGNNNELFIANNFDIAFDERLAKLQCIDLQGNKLFGSEGKTLITNPDFKNNTSVIITPDYAKQEIVCVVNGVNDAQLQALYVQKTNFNGDLLLPPSGVLLKDNSILPALISVSKCDSTYKCVYASWIDNQIFTVRFSFDISILADAKLCASTGTKYWHGMSVTQPMNGQSVLFFIEERSGQASLFAQNISCDNDDYKEIPLDDSDTQNQLFIPNVFTPNNDGFNDYFEILSKGYEHINIQIFNRWGENVFESKNQYEFWDGNHRKNGEEISSGTYYYILQLKNESTEEDLFFKGYISVIK